VTESIGGYVYLAEVGKATCEKDTDDNPWIFGVNPPIDFATIHVESTQVYSTVLGLVALPSLAANPP
jgi:hypothetical protein